MLSRLRPQEVDVLDTNDCIEPQTGTVTWSLPLKYDGIDKKELNAAQRTTFPDLWNQALDEDNGEYEVHEGIMYSCRRPGLKQAQYPRIVLPEKWRAAIIDRCHTQTGHSGLYRTLRAITEAYVWPGLKKDLKSRLLQCGVCQVHKATPEHTYSTVECQCHVTHIK